MATYEIAQRIAAPRMQVWEIIGWAGAKSLADGTLLERIEIDPPRPVLGSVRSLFMPGQPIIKERLIAYSEEDCAYEYEVIDAGGLPATDYFGRVCVTASGPDACYVSWRCNCTPVGMSEEEWGALYVSIEQSIAQTIRIKLGVC